MPSRANSKLAGLLAEGVTSGSDRRDAGTMDAMDWEKIGRCQSHDSIGWSRHDEGADIGPLVVTIKSAYSLM